MNTVYGALYDIVEQHLQENNKVMPCSKQAFLYAVDTEPGVCDEKRMAEMENSVFFESAFVGLLSRFPDENARAAWEYEMQKDSVEFRQNLLNAVIGSQEALLKGGCLINNLTGTTALQDYPALNQIITDVPEPEIAEQGKMGIKDRLYRGYQRLPLSIRLFVRKILKRG